jgi:hypothetical protein
MSQEDELRAKLRKIEALFSGAKTDGERAAAGAALERIRSRLEETGAREPQIEMRFAIHDPWSRKLFVALCRRYGLRPFRHLRMRRQSVVLRVPRTFLDETLWPEFVALNQALTEYLAEITERIIREEVFHETGEAEEMAEGAGGGAAVRIGAGKR